MKAHYPASRLLLLLAVTAGLLSSSAWGAAPPPPPSAPLSTFAPPTNDPALSILGKLTGDVGGLGFFPGGLNAEITSMFTVFNTAVISVAAIFFMWNLLSATLQGAHDGEFLGKRYHSYWMPLRTFTGIFLLMPLFAGWSAAQVFMAWAAWGGTGIANHVAGASSAIVQTQTAQHIAMPPAPDFRQAVTDVKSLYERVIAYKQAQLARSNSGLTAATDPFLAVNFTTTMTVLPDRVRISAGANPPRDGYAADSLGAYEYVIGGAAASYLRSEGIKTAFSSAVLQVIQDANLEIRGYANQLGAVDQYSSSFYTINGDYQAAMLTLPSRLQKQVLALLESAQQSAASMPAVRPNGDSFSTSYGWIGAGMGIVDGTLISYEASSLFGKGEVKGGTSGKADFEATTTAALANADKTKLSRAEQAAKLEADRNTAAAEAALAAGDLDGASYYQSLAAADADVSRSGLGGIIDSVTKAVTDGWEFVKQANFNPIEIFNGMMQKVVKFLSIQVTEMMSAQTNPIAAMQNLGVGIMGILGWIFAAFGVLVGTALIIGAVPAIATGISGVLGGLLSALAFFMGVIGIPLAFFALKLAGILPFMPVIIWLGAVVSYFVIYLESLFGAQLWGLVHLDPDGEGMGQRTTHGYVFILNLLFRPAMMVICLAFAYSLLNIAGGLGISALGGILAKVTSNPANGWLMPLMMTIGCIWVFVSLMETLIHTCMSVVHVVPKQVITWIGGTFGSDVGTDIDRSVQGGATSMAGSAGGTAMQAGMPAMNRAAAAGDNIKRDRSMPVRNADGSVGSQTVRASQSEMRGAQDSLRQADLRSAAERDPSRMPAATSGTSGATSGAAGRDGNSIKGEDGAKGDKGDRGERGMGDRGQRGEQGERGGGISHGREG